MADESKERTQEVKIHMVEYVNATAGTTEPQGTVIIATIRPDEGSWRPHNLGIRAEQAEKLRRDLNRLWKRSRTVAAWKQRRQAQAEQGGPQDE